MSVDRRLDSLSGTGWREEEGRVTAVVAADSIPTRWMSA